MDAPRICDVLLVVMIVLPIVRALLRLLIPTIDSMATTSRSRQHKMYTLQDLQSILSTVELEQSRYMKRRAITKGLWAILELGI